MSQELQQKALEKLPIAEAKKEVVVEKPKVSQTGMFAVHRSAAGAVSSKINSAAKAINQGLTSFADWLLSRAPKAPKNNPELVTRPSEPTKKKVPLRAS